MSRPRVADLRFTPDPVECERCQPDGCDLACVLPEGNPCGHVEMVSGCGGCDPSAIDMVLADGARMWRPFDPSLDMQGGA